MSDVLCDFCHGEWVEIEPLIEGHHGSCICGKCLAVAYTEVVVSGADSGPKGYQCTMCLEHRGEPAWQSPMHEPAVICTRCIKQGAGVLHKSPDFAWRKPDADPRALDD